MSKQLSLSVLLFVVFLALPYTTEAQSSIDFLHNGEKFYSKNGVAIDTLGVFEVEIANAKALVKNPKKPIGIVLSLARGNRTVGSPILSQNFQESNDAFNWLMKQAKPGDRIVLELTNTSKQHTYAIPLLSMVFPNLLNPRIRCVGKKDQSIFGQIDLF